MVACANLLLLIVAPQESDLNRNFANMSLTLSIWQLIDKSFLSYSDRKWCGTTIKGDV